MKKHNNWIFSHSEPNEEMLKSVGDQLWKWAAVGPIPKDICLDTAKCITIKNIPLLNCPAWIGVDRALAGWAALNKAKNHSPKSNDILIADAGTIFSITRIGLNGQFNGGQLMAGLHLQRSTMTSRVEQLPSIACQDLPQEMFPSSTEQAMARGSFQALLGALIETQREGALPIWLCGGDSKLFFHELQRQKLEVYYEPNLVLDAMIKIEINQQFNPQSSII